MPTLTHTGHLGHLCHACKMRAMFPEPPNEFDLQAHISTLEAENTELREQLTYQTDRAESFCTRLHEEEHRNEELRQRCETMSAYLRTHDHRLHDAAMAAAKEH